MGALIAALRWLLAVFFGLMAIAGLIATPVGGLLLAMAAVVASPPGGRALGGIPALSRQRNQVFAAIVLFFAGMIVGPVMHGTSQHVAGTRQVAKAPKLPAKALFAKFEQQVEAGDPSAALTVAMTLRRTWPASAEAQAIGPRLAALQAEVVADRKAAAMRKQAIARAAKAKIAAEETVARKKFTAEFATLRRERDDVEGVTFYYDRNVPMNVVANYFGLYFGVPDKGEPYLRWRFMYTGSDWLFIEAMKFNVDGEMVGPVRFPFGAIERDNSGDGVWEWRDEPVTSAGEIAPLLKIAASKKTVLRLEGRQYRKDREITPREKTAMLTILDAYAGVKRWGKPR